MLETQARNVGLVPARLSCGEHIALRIDDFAALGYTLDLEGSSGLQTAAEEPSPVARLAAGASGEWPWFPSRDGAACPTPTGY